MTTGDGGCPGAAADQVWLTERELAAWMPFVRLLTVLPNALDRQLREDAGISHVYYMVLAMLSDAPDGQLRMSELARYSGTSLSRLSHAVASLEERGWVERRPCPDDRRGQLAVLTDLGRQAIAEVAPAHVAEVRRRIFDQLTADEVDTLGRVAAKLLVGLD